MWSQGRPGEARGGHSHCASRLRFPYLAMEQPLSCISPCFHFLIKSLEEQSFLIFTNPRSSNSHFIRESSSLVGMLSVAHSEAHGRVFHVFFLVLSSVGVRV